MSDARNQRCPGFLFLTWKTSNPYKFTAMTHEKIFKREDGSQVKIDVTFHLEYFHNQWRILRIYTKAKGKRTWIIAAQRNSWLPESEKEKLRDTMLQLVTESEMLEAMTELWGKMKPNLSDTKNI